MRTSGCPIHADEVVESNDTDNDPCGGRGLDHRVTAAPREIYLNDPKDDLPEDLLTEIQFPIDDPA